MVTRFTLKKDAEAFCRELEDRYGVGVYHRLYKGHRHYCVQHNASIYAKERRNDVVADAKGIEDDR